MTQTFQSQNPGSYKVTTAQGRPLAGQLCIPRFLGSYSQGSKSTLREAEWWENPTSLYRDQCPSPIPCVKAPTPEPKQSIVLKDGAFEG